MSQGLKRRHEGLANYLQPLGAPGDVRVVGLQPRQPVAPGGRMPGGFRPIPTSSQRPKGTNATIVYSRTAVADTRKLGRIGQFFKEGDLISAEVMQVNTQDGKISLQTRSIKYGCLSNGFLLKVDSNYVRRMKNHFVELEGPVGSAAKIQLIIGTNGYIWISCK